MEFSLTADVLSWNRRIFVVLGLWPLSINDRNFVFFFGYLAIHCFMEYCELFQYIDNFEYVIVNLTENVFLTLVLIKLGAYRLNAKRLNRLLMDIKEDYEEENYKTLEEKLAFFEYNAISKKFMKMALPSMFMTALLYYVRPLTGQLVTGNIGKKNYTCTN
uniref:Odorant receptor 33 n=1 Tax=Sirex noctilio TaxID=36765 RepID=A0A857N3C0_9HYME|nr:odorant receptor 33 [Sirex noctilio]